MMNASIPPSNIAGVVGVIDPDAYAAGSVSTGWVSLVTFQALMALVLAGDLGADATLDGKFEQAKDAAGTGAKDVAGKAITQLTKAGTDDNKQAVVNLRADELDVNAGFTHARFTLTVGTAASDAGAVLLGFHPRYGSASASDAATVDEIVA